MGVKELEKEYLKFRQLMNIRLVDFAVCHIDADRHPAGRIAELDKKMQSINESIKEL